MKKTAFIWAILLLQSPLVMAANYNCQNIETLHEDQTLIDKSTESLETLLNSQQKVSKIIISKDQKRMFLFSDNTLLRTYSVALGRSPYGPKIMEGDNKTPEGTYHVDFKKKDSDYYKALHISYPNKVDLERTRKFAESQGVKANPGGDIMIHGFPNNPETRYWVEKGHPLINWTRGCIAVTNNEIEEVYQLVPVKVEVEICPARKRGDTMTILNMSEKILTR